MPQRIAERYEVGPEVASGPLAILSQGQLLGDGGFARPILIRTLRGPHRADRRFVSAWASTASELARAASPHVEQFVDVVCTDEHTYFLSEWIEGVSAEAWLATFRETGEPVPWPLAVEVAIEVLRGLADAHGLETPLVHGAIGPATVRIAKDGTVKLIRFGAAVALAATGAGRHELEARGLQHSAPELLEGGSFTEATDQHGVGQLLFALLSGEPLYDQSPGPERDAALREEIPDLSAAREDLPPLLVASVERALRIDPEERFRSVGRMLATLAQLLRSQPEPAGPEVLAASIRALWSERSGEHLIEREAEEPVREDVAKGARALAASVQAMLGGPAPSPTRQTAIPIKEGARPKGLPTTSTMHVDLDELTELYEEEQREASEAPERPATTAATPKKVITRERTKTYEFGYKVRAQEQNEQREASAEYSLDDDDDEAEPVPLTTRSGEHPLGLSPQQTEMLNADEVALLTIPPASGEEKKKRRAVPKKKRPTGIGRNETEMLDADALDELRIDE